MQGDEQAYSWLYRTYVQLLYNYGSHFTMDHELIKDCIQEVFTRIYKNRKTLSLPDNARVYLLISLKNCILNALDKQCRYTDLESIPFILSETVEDRFLSDEAAKLQKEEVEAVRWMDYEECRQKVHDGTMPNCIYEDEFRMVGEYLDRVSVGS